MQRQVDRLSRATNNSLQAATRRLYVVQYPLQIGDGQQRLTLECLDFVARAESGLICGRSFNHLLHDLPFAQDP